MRIERSENVGLHNEPRADLWNDLNVAVLIPCFNEAVSIQKVVREFQTTLPSATIYVYDNNSTDDTVRLARGAGAIVRSEPLQGKGNVVRRMFADVEADIYLLVDGDDTYDAADASKFIAVLLSGPFDMVTGVRITDARVQLAYRPGHLFGKALLTWLLKRIFGREVHDVFSGYRAFSRRFVKSLPALTTGFEVETELVLHALELRMPITEVNTPYKGRPKGSTSKLRTFRDGFRVLKTVFLFLKEDRPFQFFGVIFVGLASLSIALGFPVVREFFVTGLVPRLPTAVLASAIMLLAFLSLTAGLVLDTVTRGRHEIKRLYYLSISAVKRAP